MRVRPVKSSRAARRLRFETLETRDLLSTLSVTTALDGAPGSLRDVVDRADTGDVIRFASHLRGRVIPLTLGEIAVSKSVTVRGTNQAIDAGGLSRIFAVEGPDVDVALSGLTLRNGLAPFDPEFGYVGGALTATDARLNLTRVSFVGNQAIALEQSLDEFGAAPARGGALFVNRTELVMEACTVQNNRAIASANTELLVPGWAQGGGLMAIESQVTMVGGRFFNNQAVGGSGVGEYAGDFTQVDGGWGEGGAVFLIGTDASLTNTTFDQNVARGGRGLDQWLVAGELMPGQGGAGAGGAIMALPGQAESVAGDRFEVPAASTSALVLNRVQFRNNQAIGGDSGGNMDDSRHTSGGEAYGGAIVQGPGVVLTISGGTLSANVARGGNGGASDTDQPAEFGNSGGDAYGGAIYSREFASATANKVAMRNNRAIGGNGADAEPGTGREGGEPGYANGGAWSLYTPKFSQDPDELGLEVAIQGSVFSGNRAESGRVGLGVSYLALHGMYQGYARGGALSALGQILVTSTSNTWSENAAVASPGQSALGGAVLVQTFFATNSGLTSSGDRFVSNLARGGDDPIANESGDDYQYRDMAFGGAAVVYARTIHFDRAQFLRNTAEGGNDTGKGRVGAARGGAVWMFAGEDLDAIFINSKFTGNQARGGRVLHGDLEQVTSDWTAGGAIAALNRPVVIVGGEFSNNRATTLTSAAGADAYGGAIYMTNHTEAISPPLTLTRVRLTENQAAASGANVARGGAVAIGDLNAMVDHGSTFYKNSARNTGGGQAYGGAIATQGSVTLTGTRLSSNTALAVQATRRGPLGQGYGGAIAFLDNPHAELVGTWFARNRASTAGNNTWGDYHDDLVQGQAVSMSVFNVSNGHYVSNGSQLSFGTVSKGSSAPTKLLTIKNTGTQDLKLGNFELPAGSGFSVTKQGTPWPAAISPGQSVSFSITMSTSVIGTKDAPLTIRYGDTGAFWFLIHLAGKVTA